MTTRKEIKYHYRGRIERGMGSRYVWRAGYSRGDANYVSYPWLTKRECQRDAVILGGKAIFYRDGKQESR